MITNPKIITQTHHVGDLSIQLDGENWGNGLEDTKVSINGQLLCWVTWKEKDNFLNELKDVINKYRI
jgi:hypothetical protein